MKPRPIRIEGDVAYVSLTKGYEAIIDVEDVPLVEGRNWHAHVVRKKDRKISIVYAYRTEIIGGEKVTVIMHRLLTSAQDDTDIDHRDGNGLNNRRRGETGNLRSATKSQNMHNRRLNANNTSRFKGVSWNASHRKWHSQIMAGRVRKHLGYFNCRTAAAVAYMKASKQHHGEFGRTA